MHNEYGKEEGLADRSCNCVGAVSIICSLIAVSMPKTDVTAESIDTRSVEKPIITTENTKDIAGR